tara:strand:- start:22 stop:345 length:324 start_codon:yes stop_codon:yes gene_type:complete
MDHIISQFEDEVKEAWRVYYEDYADDEDDDLDERKEAFLLEEYNTINKTSCECKDFINYNLTIYLAMEEEVISKWEEEYGDWEGYGIVKVVNLWRYMKADEILREME